MSKEIEVKIRLDDFAGARKLALNAGAAPTTGRHFEDNLVLDSPDGLLSTRRSLLRLRSTSEGGVVTYKGPPEMGSAFKIREELETAVSDPDFMLQIFERLGFQMRFRYQKYREEFVLETRGGEVKVALDDTPIGSYAELEGNPESIWEAAAVFGFSEVLFLRDSYYGLYLQFCAARGETPHNMVFEPSPARDRILQGEDNS